MRKLPLVVVVNLHNGIRYQVVVIAEKKKQNPLTLIWTTCKNKVFEAHRQLTEKDDSITAERLRDQFQGKIEKQCTLIDVFKDHNHKMETLVGSGSLKALRSVTEPL
ncbi:hypothetical protein GM920_06580 [Pedobacter sp. LMG 31462]|uniref:Transposase IS111A/IS1328/IS1533 N-terminal domain-containing protein n=1 Tax=Pedobacter gandavensis TaxID=2679963 RepID=A0ABR6ETI2_9SPHI|nr:hypothetical protein [Pedobacter gandavensis]